jgi:hypothetical protein
LVLLFPLIAGAIAGGLLTRGVYAGKVRSPFVAFIVGLMCGILMYGVYHVVSYYIGFRGDFRNVYVERTGKSPSDTELDTLLNSVMQEDVGDTGIMGYLKETAKEGITITSTSSYGSTRSSDTLKGNLVWGYYAVEILLAGLIAAFMAAGAAGQPFDEDAGEWYGPPMYLAAATGKSRKELLNALKVGDFQQAGALLTRDNIKYPRVNVSVRRSRSSSSQDVYLQLTYNTRSNRANNLKKGVITSSDFEGLQRGMNQAAPNPAAIR